jgi:hypothetical protein
MDQESKSAFSDPGFWIAQAAGTGFVVIMGVVILCVVLLS